jgi:hypothetical protein
MFKILLLPCIGIVVLLQFRCIKESKNYRVVERKESFYIDTNGIENEYINSNPITNKYEH